MGEAKRRKQNDPTWGKLKTMRIRNPDTGAEFDFRLKKYEGFVVVENREITAISNNKKDNNSEDELTFLWEIYDTVSANLLEFYNTDYDENIFTFEADFSKFFSDKKAILHFYPSWWDFANYQYRTRRSLEIRADTLEKLSTAPPTDNDTRVGSPKSPHERVGHWRQYKNGKRIWVRSCKINQYK